MRKEDEEEDYLDDSKSSSSRDFGACSVILTTMCFFCVHRRHKDTVNPTKCGCPFALKMAACQLLLEITTFLRETFPCLPRPRTEPLVVGSNVTEPACHLS